LLVSVGACVAACSAAPVDETVSSTQAPLDKEHIGAGYAPHEAELVWREYGENQDITQASYAAPSVDGCSASMIGPNILMTAGHCGFWDASGNLPDKNATFKTYRFERSAGANTETFRCHPLLSTWGSRSAAYDLALMYCDPNGFGENPGDKYGYLDLDTSAPTVGQALYSPWANDLVDTGEPDARLYSAGSVASLMTSTSDPFTHLTMWGQPGASGSPHLNAANHRILVGPLSTAAGMSRNAISMKYYVEQGSSIGDSSPGYFAPRQNSILLIKKLPGLFANEPNPGVYHNLARYTGLVDRRTKDANGPNHLFDVQEDLELAAGETARDVYHLGFESERRNNLWTVLPGASIDAPKRMVHASRNGGTQTVLTHSHLPLVAGKTYRVSVMTNTSTTSEAFGLRLSLRTRGTSTIEDYGFVTTPAGAGWQLSAFTLRAETNGPELDVATRGATTLDIAAIEVIEDGAIVDFDSFDERFDFRNDNTGGRAKVLPDGRDDGSGRPNWAAVVTPDSSRARDADWPVRNRALALVKGESYRLCFDVIENRKTVGGDSVPAPGVARVVSGGNAVLSFAFPTSRAWSHVCTTGFSVPSGDNNVTFGTSLASNGTIGVGYYLDNLQVVPAAATTTNASSGTIHVRSATYGAVCGESVSIGNTTAELGQRCNGMTNCGYIVDYTRIGDPAPGCGKDFTIEYTCGTNPRKHRVALPAEAGLGSIASLSCSGITVESATYGNNLLGSSDPRIHVTAGNAKSDIASKCNGEGVCHYAVDYTVLGDPAPGFGKDFVVDYTCIGVPGVRHATVPAEAGFGGIATLTCP
jgi:hypothetical protein